MRARHQAIAAFIAPAGERLRADPARREQPPNLLEAMIVAADDGNTGIDDQQVAGNVLTMLLAGKDTTANTLAWLLHLLHRHPPALARACDEVRRVAAPETGTPEDFTPERLAALDYLEACIHETMRLKPVAPFTVREALRECTIGDVRIDSGAPVWCVMRHDSVSAEHLERPETFDPQRWLNGKGPDASADSSADTTTSRAKRVSMPFGAGPRTCPARYLALLEMKMAPAMLLGSFDIESVEAPADRHGELAEERMSFTMVPVGLRMKLLQRGQ